MSALTLIQLGARAAGPAGGAPRRDQTPEDGSSDAFGAVLERSGLAAGSDSAPVAAAEGAEGQGGDVAAPSRAGVAGDDWLTRLTNLSRSDQSGLSDASPPSATGGLAMRANEAASAPLARSAMSSHARLSEDDLLPDGPDDKARAASVSDTAVAIAANSSAWDSNVSVAQRVAAESAAVSRHLALSREASDAADKAKRTASCTTGAKDEPQETLAPQPVLFAADPASGGGLPSAAASAAFAAGLNQQAEARAGTPAESDACAQLSAVLARPGGRPSSALRAPRERVEQDLSTTRPSDAAPISVFVTNQRTWLEPACGIGPGQNPPQYEKATAKPADHAAPPAADIVAEASEHDAPTSFSAQTMQPLASPDGTGLGAPRQISPTASGVQAAAGAPSSAPDSPIAARPLGPRRDLDATLEPRELGGLVVRMKSAGDRLEISFVADKDDTARLIGDHSAVLESRLHDAGLGPAGVSISVAARVEGGGPSGADPSAPATQAGPQGDWRGERDPAPRRQDRFSADRQDSQNEGRGKADESSGRRDDRGLYL